MAADMQDLECGLRRIYLPRTPVNRGEKKEPGPNKPRPLPTSLLWPRGWRLRSERRGSPSARATRTGVRSAPIPVGRLDAPSKVRPALHCTLRPRLVFAAGEEGCHKPAFAAKLGFAMASQTFTARFLVGADAKDGLPPASYSIAIFVRS
jgi:hypothetical protein